MKTHDSFGLISLNKHSSNKSIELFGSNIKHESLIELTINFAETIEDEYHSKYYPREKIISIYLSPVQLVNLLTTMNSDGTPCTITYTKELGRIENLKNKSIKQKINDNIDQSILKLKQKLKHARENIDDNLTGTINKKQKENIRNFVISICNDFESNIEYLFDCQLKKLEQTGAEIVADTEAKVLNIIQNAGIKSLKQNDIKLLD